MADSLDGIQKESEITGQIPPTVSQAKRQASVPSPLPKTENDIKKGFVYNRVPHIMLKHISNNPEIDTIHAKWQEKLEPIRAQLNQLLHQSWEEWEIPREAEKTWSKDVQQLHEEWWRYRRERQKELDEEAWSALYSTKSYPFLQPATGKIAVKVINHYGDEVLKVYKV